MALENCWGGIRNALSPYWLRACDSVRAVGSYMRWVFGQLRGRSPNRLERRHFDFTRATIEIQDLPALCPILGPIEDMEEEEQQQH